MRLMTLLFCVLFAAAGVANEPLEITASKDTVVLLVKLPLDAVMKENPSEDVPDAFAFMNANIVLSPKVGKADEAISAIVDSSFSGQSYDNALNKNAVKLRRDWAEGIDELLQKWRMNCARNCNLELSVFFPNTREKELLKQYRDWPTVKEKLAASDKDEDMKALLKYRRRLTDALLAVAWLRMRQDLPPDIDKRKEVEAYFDFAETEPVGSVTRTSDLDVTTVGYACSDAVRYFNEYFRRDFCLESGIVLDSNVYCEVFKVHDQVPGAIQAIRDSPDNVPPCQDAMALAKLRRYMTVDEWNGFKGAKPSTSVMQAAEIYAFYEGLLEPKLGKAPAECEKNSEGAPTCGVINCNDNGVMEVSNDLYAQSLDRLRRTLRSGIKDADRIKFEQSAANLFANESYNSQGPLLHVLGVLQGKDENLRSRLSKEQLLSSLNEQIGDALKDLTHYAHIDAPFGEALYKSAKYVDRALDAEKTLRKNFGIGESDSTLTQLFGPGSGYNVEELIKIRKGEEPPYKGMKSEDKAAAAKKQSGKNEKYESLRKNLVDAVIDMNTRARQGESGRCPYPLSLQ